MSKFSDSYESAVRELVEAKLHDRPLPSPKDEQPGGQVIDLMEALKKSLGGPTAGAPKAGKKAPSDKAAEPDAAPPRRKASRAKQ